RPATTAGASRAAQRTITHPPALGPAVPGGQFWTPIGGQNWKPIDSRARSVPLPAPRGHSVPEAAQARMIGGPSSQRPVVGSVLLVNRPIVDAGMAHRHQAVRIELPVFIAVRPEPVAR